MSANHMHIGIAGSAVNAFGEIFHLPDRVAGKLTARPALSAAAGMLPPADRRTTAAESAGRAWQVSKKDCLSALGHRRVLF